MMITLQKKYSMKKCTSLLRLPEQDVAVWVAYTT